MTCWSCVHIRRVGRDFLCALTGESRPERCEAFVYEPGSDEAER